jgi:membrane-associated phospholipid phosphatase
VKRAIFRLRPEECATLLLFVPTAWALARMAALPRPVVPAGDPAAGYPDAVARLVGLGATALAIVAVARWNPRWRLIRDAMPFLFAANLYASLHDLIRFCGAPDITRSLYRLDVWLLGGEPTVWAERFTNPILTDFFTVCYWLFYVLPPLLGLLLYLKGKRAAFRATMVSVVFCLFAGYIGYVAFPASAPRLAIPDAYLAPLHGWWVLDYTRTATRAVPLTAYGAFPSLHCGVMLLSIILAWRYHKWFFWIQLPFGTGLVLGTVYLRHHWVVDILGGFALAVFFYWAGPRIERWWTRAASLPAGGAEWPEPAAGAARTAATAQAAALPRRRAGVGR